MATRRRSATAQVYGASKLLAGEDGVHAIPRTSWLFSAYGRNFVKMMLKVAQERNALRVVADQTGGPTPAAAIAAACRDIARTLRTDPGATGAYHFSGAPDVSWADSARGIFAAAGRGVLVEDIQSRDYLAPAPRPRNSRLDCTATRSTFGTDRPDWRQGLSAVLTELH